MFSSNFIKKHLFWLVMLIALLLAIFVYEIAKGEGRNYPLNSDLIGFIGSCNDKKERSEGIEVISRVEKEDLYVYIYRIRNIGKIKTWLVNWTVPDRATRFGENFHIFTLKPGEETKVIMKHKDPPFEYHGMLTLYARGTDFNVKDWYKDNNIIIHGNDPTLIHFSSGGQPGPLPLSLHPKKER